MKQLRAIRILLATLFFVASAACLVLGPQVHPMAAGAEKAQIILSASEITAGATIVWLLLSFLFGRAYCSVACPVGNLSDIFFSVRRRVRKLNKPFSYRHRSHRQVHVLWIYLLCIVIGLLGVPFLIEPWNMARNIASPFNPDTVSHTWMAIGLGVGTGIAAGILSAILIAATSLIWGREICSRWCPIGYVFGLPHERTLFHIEIDPDKCISCGHCEEVCRAQCIKTVSRYVDNSRCVLCFDCVAECPSGAIRYQYSRNRPATPLMRKTASGKRL